MGGAPRSPPPRLPAPRLLAAAFLLSASVVQPASAQTALPAPGTTVRPPVIDVPVLPHTTAAVSPSGGWALARATAVRHSGIPQEMAEKLQEFTAAGRAIDAVAFTPDGRGWTVVAGNAAFTRNVGGSGADAYFTTLNDGLARGKQVRAVAFNPVGWETGRGYVILWKDGTASYRGIPTEMVSRLSAFQQVRAEFRGVAFTPGGGWTIATATGSFARNVGGTEAAYFTRITALEGQNRLPEAVGFNPNPAPGDQGWFIVTAQGVELKNLPGGFRRDLAALLNRPITEHSAAAAAFDPANPVVIVLLHGKTDYPSGSPQQRIGTLSHPLYYWGFDFVWDLLGGETPFVRVVETSNPASVTMTGVTTDTRTLHNFAGTPILKRNWTPTTNLPGADPRAHLLSIPRYTGSGTLPARSVLLTYREGHRSLPDQTRDAIHQIYNVYQAQFGQSAVKPRSRRPARFWPTVSTPSPRTRSSRCALSPLGSHLLAPIGCAPS